jgi:hypothetical protein
MPVKLGKLCALGLPLDYRAGGPALHAPACSTNLPVARTFAARQ